MERLPDRPDYEVNYNSVSSQETKKEVSRKEKLGTYGMLILLIVIIFIVMQKTEVPLNEITVTDCSTNDSYTSLFVAGTIADGDKFAGSQVDFNKKNGIATITLYKYTTPTLFGNENFAAMIDISDSEPTEIRLQCGDDTLPIL